MRDRPFIFKSNTFFAVLIVVLADKHWIEVRVQSMNGAFVLEVTVSIIRAPGAHPAFAGDVARRWRIAGTRQPSSSQKSSVPLISLRRAASPGCTWSQRAGGGITPTLSCCSCGSCLTRLTMMSPASRGRSL